MVRDVLFASSKDAILLFFFFRFLLPLLFLLRISEILLFRFSLSCHSWDWWGIERLPVEWFVQVHFSDGQYLIDEFAVYSESSFFSKEVVCFWKSQIGQNMFRKIQETLEEMSNTSENGGRTHRFVSAMVPFSNFNKTQWASRISSSLQFKSFIFSFQCL